MGGNSSRWIFYNPEKYDKELEGFNGLWSAERKRLGKPLESQETSREYWLILERGNDSLRPNVYFYFDKLMLGGQKYPKILSNVGTGWEPGRPQCSIISLMLCQGGVKIVWPSYPQILNKFKFISLDSAVDALWYVKLSAIVWSPFKCERKGNLDYYVLNLVGLYMKTKI